MKIKLSFDFDDTLELKSVQSYAQELIEKGYDVHIVTTRYEDPSNYEGTPKYGDLPIFANHNFDIFQIAQKLKIPMENIHFTNMKIKGHFFAENPGFLWHLDNNHLDLKHINKNSETIGLSVYKNYKNKGNRIIKKYEDE